jgi:hypothetical protein
VISEDVESRLFNFKFRQAHDALWAQEEDATVEEREMVAALAMTYSDVGWFAGAISTVLWAAVKFICETPKKTDDEQWFTVKREGDGDSLDSARRVGEASCADGGSAGDVGDEPSSARDAAP